MGHADQCKGKLMLNVFYSWMERMKAEWKLNESWMESLCTAADGANNVIDYH